MCKKEDKGVEKSMWQAYAKDKSKANRDRLIEYYLKFADIIARKAYTHFGGIVEYGDLLSDAVIGLIDAISKFDYTKGVKFNSYANRRIFGEILDAQRLRDWKARSHRDKEKKAINPVDVGEMGYLQDMFENSGFEPRSLAAKIDIEKVENRIDTKNILNKIKGNFDSLTDTERKVIILYYVKNMRIGEIGVRFGVSESRISQLKTNALKKLARVLKREYFYNC